MSLATLKMIDDLISEMWGEAHCEGGENGPLVVPLRFSVNRLVEIYDHLEESLKRDGFTFVEDKS